VGEGSGLSALIDLKKEDSSFSEEKAAKRLLFLAAWRGAGIARSAWWRRRK
jgi:hypothetical protein